MTLLIFEGVRIEWTGLGWPVADGVIDMGEHSERIGAADQAGYLRQVPPHNLGRWLLPDTCSAFQRTAGRSANSARNRAPGQTVRIRAASCADIRLLEPEKFDPNQSPARPPSR